MLQCRSPGDCAGDFGYQSRRAKTRYAARYGAVAGGDPNLPGADAPYSDPNLPGADAPYSNPNLLGTDAPYSDLLTHKGGNPALPPISLQLLGHRWYDPAMGRFLQRDPMGLLGGLNLYAYALGQPVTAVDPLGLYVAPDWDWDDYTVNIIDWTAGCAVIGAVEGAIAGSAVGGVGAVPGALAGR